jgi:hypothetical protein
MIAVILGKHTEIESRLKSSLICGHDATTTIINIALIPTMEVMGGHAWKKIS